MPALRLTHADEPRKIANDMIAEIHQHLKLARIAYVFTTQKRVKCDRIVLGKAQKLSAKLRWLSSGLEDMEKGYDFIIEFDANEWKNLTEPQRKALVDHELCHCAGGPGQWRVRGHDVEEFQQIIERHGFWKQDLQYFGSAAQQLPLVEPERGFDDEEHGRFDKGTVTLSTGDRSVTVTGKQFREAAERM